LVFFHFNRATDLIGLALKFLFGKAPPPKPDQEISDELFDEIEHTSSRRRRRKRSRNQPSSDE
jgi:hypothetical protein